MAINVIVPPLSAFRCFSFSIFSTPPRGKENLHKYSTRRLGRVRVCWVGYGKCYPTYPTLGEGMEYVTQGSGTLGMV